MEAGNLYACLWVVVTPTVTVFRIQAERSRSAAMKVLGKVHGMLGSDRYSVYDCWPKHMHQFCWAHLARLFVQFSERSDPKAAAVGRALTVAKDEMFDWWYRVRDGTLARSTFQRQMRPCKTGSPVCFKKVCALAAPRRGGRVFACRRTPRRCGPS